MARKQHPHPAACRDRDCTAAVCLAYREGYEDGFTDGMHAAAGQ